MGSSFAIALSSQITHNNLLLHLLKKGVQGLQCLIFVIQAYFKHTEPRFIGKRSGYKLYRGFSFKAVV